LTIFKLKPLATVNIEISNEGFGGANSILKVDTISFFIIDKLIN